MRSGGAWKGLVYGGIHFLHQSYISISSISKDNFENNPSRRIWSDKLKGLFTYLDSSIKSFLHLFSATDKRLFF